MELERAAEVAGTDGASSDRFALGRDERMRKTLPSITAGGGHDCMGPTFVPVQKLPKLATPLSSRETRRRPFLGPRLATVECGLAVVEGPGE